MGTPHLAITPRDQSQKLDLGMTAPFKLQRYPFDRRVIQGAPNEAGLYVLWESDELTYIGSVEPPGLTIRQRLLEHWSGRNHCACKPTHYSWRLALYPAELHEDWLRLHSATFQALPRCNKAG